MRKLKDNKERKAIGWYNQANRELNWYKIYSNMIWRRNNSNVDRMYLLFLRDNTLLTYHTVLFMILQFFVVFTTRKVLGATEKKVVKFSVLFLLWAYWMYEYVQKCEQNSQFATSYLLRFSLIHILPNKTHSQPTTYYMIRLSLSPIPQNKA